MESILIPTGYDPGSYSCVRSMARRGINPIVATQYDSVPAAHSRFCDEVIKIPPPDEDLISYKDALLGIAARKDVRTIVSLRPHDPYVFAKYADEFEPYVSLVTPLMEQLETATDRLDLVAAAEEAGVPAPATRRLSEVDDWSTEQIVKSRYNLLTESSVDDLDAGESEVVKRIEHLESGERPAVDVICDAMKHDPIVQEFIRASDEYVFAALYDSGEPLATFQHRQIRGNSYTHGGGVYRKSVDIPELEAVGRTLLDQLDWHGLACIEYMRDAETGEFVLAEINPRLWQSLPCAVNSGADFPHYYWLAATDQSESIEPEYDSGVGSHLLYGEFGHLVSILNEESTLVDRPSLFGRAIEIAASCYEMPNFDNLRSDDPMPFISGVSHVVKDKF